MKIPGNHLRRMARLVSPLAFALVAAGPSLAHAQEGERVVPIDKVVLGNRLDGPVTVFLLPDLGTYQIAAGAADEFACAIVKGFALSAGGTKFGVDCGKRYAITSHPEGLTIVEVVLTKDRP